MKWRIGGHTSDELERSGAIGWVGLDSVDTPGLGMWPLLLPLVEGPDIDPWLCKACDKLCNFARSSCIADTPMLDSDAGANAGAGLWEIEFVARWACSTPSVRDSIEDKTVEDDRVARALDIFNGAFDAGVLPESSLGSLGGEIEGCVENEFCGAWRNLGLSLLRPS